MLADLVAQAKTHARLYSIDTTCQRLRSSGWAFPERSTTSAIKNLIGRGKDCGFTGAATRTEIVLAGVGLGSSEPLEVVGQGSGSGITPTRVLPQAFEADCLQVARTAGLEM